MKELTRVATVQLTSVVKTDNNMTDIASKEAVKERLTEAFMRITGADNMVIEVQDFIRDIEEKGVVEDGRKEDVHAEDN